MSDSLLCPWETPFLLLFSSNVPPLLYYSHLPVIVAALILGFFVYHKGGTLASTVLGVVLGLFSFYGLLDILIWASNRSDIVLFLWSLQVLIEVLIFAAALYLVHLVIKKRDASFASKLIFGLVLLPFILLIPTHYNLIGIDLSSCNAIEGVLALYASYGFEIFFTLLIIITSVHAFFSSRDRALRRQIISLTTGVILFLVALISGNLIGSFTGDWNLAQFGFFGMPIFIGFLTYLIVEFRMFNLKLIGAQALVLALVGLIASEFLFVNNATNRLLVSITFAVAVFFGFFLVRSVKREVALREALQEANEGQANLLHIINHQIKGYMTKARYVFDDLMSDTSYGLSDKALPMVKQGYDSVTEGVNFVQDFLNASNIERGTFTYTFVPIDFEEIVKNVSQGQEENAHEKGLTYTLNIAPGDYKMTGDKAQLGQAVRNLIDNSIHYTPTGSLTVTLERKMKSVLFKVSDSGVGLSDEVKPKLFTKGGRDKDSQKVNVNSTGFGLAFVKGVAEAHKGKVWAESPGPGKGSTFYMELPAA